MPTKAVHPNRGPQGRSQPEWGPQPKAAAAASRKAVDIDPELHARLNKIAKAAGVPVFEVVEAGIRHSLDA